MISPPLVVATECPWPIRNGITAKSARLLQAFPVFPVVVCPLHVHFGEPSAIVPRDLPPRGRPRGRVGRLAAYSTAMLRGTNVPCHGLLMREVAAELAALLRNSPPFVHLDTIGCAHLVPLVRSVAPAGTRVILSVNDSYSLLRSDHSPRSHAPKALQALEVGHHRRTERRAYRQVDAVDVVSPVDAAEIQRFCPEANVRLIPLGRPPVAPRRTLGAERPVDVLFFPSSPGLRSLVIEALPALLAERSRIKVTMVGNVPSQLRKHLTALGVELPGFVTDLEARLQTAKVVVAPSPQRSGSPNKALQGMANGAAVVGGRCLYGIPGFQPGLHGVVAPAGQPMGRAISDLLAERSRLSEVAGGGYDLVSSLPSWTAVAKSYLHTLPTEFSN